MKLNPGSRSVLGRIVLVCGAITAGAGALSLVGWSLGSDALTAMGTGYIPMAPNTALLLVLSGSAVLVRELWPASRFIHRVVAVAALLSAVVAAVTLSGLNIDDSLFRTTRMLGAVPMGRMSPVTAFCFVLAGVSLLLLEWRSRTWAAIFGTPIALAGGVCLMGYGFGAPLLYGGTVIPVALPTSLALLALGVGLTAAAGPDTWPIKALIGSSTSTRLLRALLPTVVPLALINSWITAILLERSDSGEVLAAAITAISFLLLVSLVVSRVSHTIGDAIDRTTAERQRAQETDARLAAIVENSNDAIISRRFLDRKILSWNAGAERLFGYTADEAIGQSVSMIIPPEREEEIARNRERLAQGIVVNNLETERLAKGGHRIAVSLSQSLIRNEHGAMVGIALIFQDITERKRIETELRASRDRLALATMSANIGVWDWDVVRNKLVWDAQMYKLYGVREQDFDGAYDAWSAGLHPDDRARCDAEAGAVLEKGEVYDTEFRVQWPDGRLRDIEAHAVVQRAADGSATRMIGVNWDVTERKRTMALAMELEAATESSRLKSDFMANVTHELRTPLNSVIGFAELLKDEVPGPLNAKQAQFAADILASGQRLLALVEGILEMSRLDAAGTTLKREQVEIGAEIEERVAAHRKAAEAWRVRIATEVAADTGCAKLDPTALRRMLDALLDNAIKFNREGGTVAVSARRANGTLKIAVADTGIGIAQEDAPKLFKPLVQLYAGLARRHGGVGMGLALTRRLAELHGGTIEVESEPGKGSTFTLRLPVGVCRT